MGYKLEERLEWRRWVTPTPLGSKPIHRWFVFPHSFTDELVHGLIDEWGLGSGNTILDPFSGAGTTLLAAKERGIPARGYDLSPLAVLAGRTKLARYKALDIEAAFNQLEAYDYSCNTIKHGRNGDCPALLRKALPGHLLEAFENYLAGIDRLPADKPVKDFLRLGLLAIVPHYSRAVATGGWLSWVDKRSNIRGLHSVYRDRINMMIDDLNSSDLPRAPKWKAHQADARSLPEPKGAFSAVITSPPYPNRHDYTRVFGVELMLAFLSWEETRSLRYQSFESHPEAHPSRPDHRQYHVPKRLQRTLKRIESHDVEPRIVRMLGGYFLDLWLSLREASRVCRRGARVAYVVGDAQYCSVPVLVDELTAEIGEQVGLTCERILVVRYRGNSAQQMARFGRRESRESVVILRKQ